MTKEEAKQWAELFTAYAEGKSIEYRMRAEGGEWLERTSFDYWDTERYEYRVKPQHGTRRMTNQELADWLRDEPHEHREWKQESSNYIYISFSYHVNDSNREVPKGFYIRRNHGDWEEPVIEVEESI